MVALHMDNITQIDIDPNMPTRWGRERVRYQFLRMLITWVNERPGIGTPSIRDFHRIVGGDKRISWSRFYRDHYAQLIREKYLSHDVDPKTGATALVLHDKCKLLDL